MANGDNLFKTYSPKARAATPNVGKTGEPIGPEFQIRMAPQPVRNGDEPRRRDLELNADRRILYIHALPLLVRECFFSCRLTAKGYRNAFPDEPVC